MGDGQPGEGKRLVHQRGFYFKQKNLIRNSGKQVKPRYVLLSLERFIKAKQV